MESGQILNLIPIIVIRLEALHVKENALTALIPLAAVAKVRIPSQCKNNYFTEMCSGSEEGSYLRLIDVCITQL